MAVVGTFWGSAGAVVVGALALATVLSAAVTPSIRRAARTAWLVTVIPHRVRVGLIEGGVTDRHGNLPFVLWAIPVDNAVRVELGTRFGTRIADLEAAIPFLAEACGTAGVEIHSRPDRPDRATILLARPRWGLI